jgi:tRNA(Ile)-lysidine synthase
MNDFSHDALWAALDGGLGDARRRRYCIAYSGGMDSTVLLEAMARLRDRLAPHGLRALHVNHGLQEAAPCWAERCAARCVGLDIPFAVLQVDARAGRGESPEAKAREARYQALGAALAHDEVLLTAHHADDQLETVLIQLLRGAGVAGLAGMPFDAEFGPGRHQRPLLGVPRAALHRWAREHGVAGWVEDPTNFDPRLSRNHLRHEALPAVRAHWPAAAAAASRAARHCAEAAALLDELAGLDAAACAEGPALQVAAMRPLSAARRRNLVRWQCRRLGLPTPDERRLATLLEQLFDAGEDRQPEVRWSGVVAVRHGGRLWLMAEAGLKERPGPRAWPDPRDPFALGGELGTFSIEPTTGGGLRPQALDAPWRVVFRTGGERLRLPGRPGSRALKKLLHAAGVPPWLRARLPLLEVNGELAAVADLWVDASQWAPPGAAAWRLRWRGCALPGRDAFVVDEQAF